MLIYMDRFDCVVPNTFVKTYNPRKFKQQLINTLFFLQHTREVLQGKNLSLFSTLHVYHFFFGTTHHFPIWTNSSLHLPGIRKNRHLTFLQRISIRKLLIPEIIKHIIYIRHNVFCINVHKLIFQSTKLAKSIKYVCMEHWIEQNTKNSPFPVASQRFCH